VLSNKPDDFTKRMVAHYFNPSPFAIGAVNCQCAAETRPAAALQIAQELAVPPAQWLYLGDTNTDMRTRAPRHACGRCAVGFSRREELVESGAEQIIARPEQVLALL